VQPAGGPAVNIPAGVIGEGGGARAIMLHPGAPLDAIKAAAPNAKITFEDGRYIESTATHAAKADVAIVFATQWTTESADVPDLGLPGNQDALIAAVAAANPHTVVVLETGGPVVMPWADKPAAILEVWYPGIKGGQAIADILFGDVNPSGKLPITFPVSLDQTPRPKLDGLYDDDFSNLHANYNIEGSDVGYRWYDRKGIKPLFAFGHGLSYTSFKYDNVEVKGGHTLHVSFRVTNTGARSGRDVPQVYVTDRAGKKGQRLIGWGNVDLAAGASQTVTVTADPRLLADWSGKGWRVPGGQYQVTVNSSAIAPQANGQANVSARNLAP
jgi:beta-glucosidase